MDSKSNTTFYNICFYFRHKGEPKQLSPLVENLKKQANALFEKEEYKQSIDVYNQAIASCSTAAVLYGNRAAAYLKRKWWVSSHLNLPKVKYPFTPGNS